ncbi:MAG: hypothetical protein K6G83_05355 [Lachnospiraceae bacterium]|nr:hypothetical protein [Lachnospiraceae bacterium]
MLINLLMTVVLAAGCLIIGAAVRKILGLQKYCLWDGPIGLAVISFFSSMLYFTFNISVQTIRYILLVLVLLSLIYVCRDLKREEIRSFLALAVIFLVLLVPGVRNRDQYYAWRGNFTDHFFYTSVALTLNEKTAKAYLDGTADTSVDLIEYGSRLAFEDRPTVCLLFSIIMLKNTGELFWHIFTFHCFLLAMIPLAMFSLAELFLNGNKRLRFGLPCTAAVILTALTYSFGFWGQVVYDINAWSQIASVALNIAVIALGIEILEAFFSEEPGAEQHFDRSRFILLLIMLTGDFTLYAENAIVHYLFLLGMFALTAIALRRVKIRQILCMAAIFPAVLLLNVAANWRILRFAMGQISISTGGGTPKPWWRFFNNYWTGFWNSGDYFMKKAVCFIPSYFGYSFIMPNMSSPLWIRIPWILFTLVLTVCIMALLAYITIYQLVKGKTVRDRLLGSCVLTGLCGAFVFIPMLKLWESGKMMTYVSPYLYLAMVIPLFIAPDLKKKSLQTPAETGSETGTSVIRRIVIYAISFAAMLLLFTNLLFSLYGYGKRITNTRGNGLGGAFPSDQLPEIKETIDFNYDTHALDDSVRSVELIVDDELGLGKKWFLSYLKLKTFFAGLDYYVEDDTDLWYQDETERKNEFRETDAKVRVLKDQDGIYEVIIQDSEEAE